MDCDFEIEGKIYSDSMIRDLIVFGISSAKVWSKLIDEGGKLTLATAIMRQNYEYAWAQLKSMSGPEATQEVHAVNRAKQEASGTFQKHRCRRQQQNPTVKLKNKCFCCDSDAHSEVKKKLFCYGEDL